LEQHLKPQTPADTGHQPPADITAYLTDSLTSVLALGDLDLLDYELDWVSQLFHHYQGERRSLDSYLRAYRQAIESQLGPAGAPIAAWFAQRTA
jgi:hypothetical protein